MRRLNNFVFFVLIILTGCTSKKGLHYLQDSNEWNKVKIDLKYLENKIEVGDILKIDVSSLVPEASVPYNKILTKETNIQNIDILKLEGYLVDINGNINFPVLGEINTTDLSMNQLSDTIRLYLELGNHLTNPTINIRRLNSKFTILGEVKNPGTFQYYDNNLTVFQALGYAGDLTVDGKRKDISLIREENGLRSVYKIELTKFNLLNKNVYQIKNNDVIIVNPSFSKVKSAGFIGSPGSIASMASILLSITLLLINN